MRGQFKESHKDYHQPVLTITTSCQTDLKFDLVVPNLRSAISPHSLVRARQFRKDLSTELETNLTSRHVTRGAA